MARDASQLSPMRHGANRAFGYAVLVSLLLHALLLLALPSLREKSAALPPAPAALVARVVRLPPPAPVAAAVPRRPLPPEPRPQSPVQRPASVAAPVPAPAPEPQPPQPVASAPAPAAAPVPLARPDVRPAPPAPPPDSAAREHYRSGINIAAARFKRYPRAAIDNNWEGEVVVLMTIGAAGRIAALRVRSSSGYDILDRQALLMFRNAKPFVPIPPVLRGRQFELELRAIYGLRDQGSG